MQKKYLKDVLAPAFYQKRPFRLKLLLLLAIPSLLTVKTCLASATSLPEDQRFHERTNPRNIRSFALAPLAPQFWGEIDPVPSFLPSGLQDRETRVEIRRGLPTLSQGQQLAQVQNSTRAKASELMQQGTQHYQSRKFEAAIQAWQGALKMYRQLQDPRGEGLTLARLGLATQDLGQPQKAIPYFEQALPKLRQANEQAMEASVLGNLGNNYFRSGNYAKAIQFYQQSIALWGTLADEASQGQALRGLGNVYIAMGNYTQALSLHQRGLAMAQASGNLEAIANAYNSLGAIQSNQRQFQQARQYYQQSLETAKQISEPAASQMLQAQALNNLGAVALSLSTPNTAQTYYQQSLAIAQALKHQRLEGTALRGIGSVYTSKKAYAQALPPLKTTLAIAKQVNDPKLEATTLHLMGANLWKLGQLDQAKTHFESAIARLEALRENLEDIDKVSIFETQKHSYALLRRVLAEQGQYDAALEAAENGRARAFIELLAKRLNSTGQLTSTLQQQTAPPSIETLRQVAIQQKATLVEYALLSDEEFIATGKFHGDYVKLLIWVVDPTGQISFREVNFGPAEAQLIQQAGAWANDWHTFRDREAELETQFQQLHQSLHRILIEPIASLLPANPEAPVIFIPHRELFQVSFPALQEANGSYLIQKHTILTAPAIQVLQFTHQQRQRLQATPRPATALVVGNPTMPLQLSSLPGSEQEAQTVAQFLNTQPMIGAAATESTIKRTIGSARTIHLATHGLLREFTNSGVPGAIALAPGNGEDGLLTSDEILNLKLNADLVVVSACDTGRGHLTGDGVVGLSRSLLATGVPSVMISLWEIADDSTAVLMSEFYRQYTQTNNKAQALRQAMLKTMQNYPHPTQWAPFTLVGEGQ